MLSTARPLPRVLLPPSTLDSSHPVLMDPTYTQLQMRLYKRELSEYTSRLYDEARSAMQAKGLTYLPPTPMTRGPASTAPQSNTGRS